MNHVLPAHLKVTIGWKQTNQAKYDWRLLQRLWRASTAR
jgi:hypothetical protein